MSNMFSGLNETMADILAKTAGEGFTPARLFVNLLADKNKVSEYFKDNSDIEKIIFDFEEADSEISDTAKFQKNLEKMLKTVKESTRDRYVDEIQFTILALQNRYINRFVSGVIGKYLNVDHIIEDLSAMIPPTPNMKWDKSEETILDAIGRNLTQLASDGELSEIVDREEETMRMVQVLTRQTKSNPILVGEAGVGKTAVVEKLAFMLNSKVGIPTSLHNHKLYEVSIPAIVATGSEEKVIEEMIKVAKRDKVIIFFDEVHLIMDQNGKIANLLKPAMARGDFKLIGATTEDEYKVFEHDKAMVRRFQPVKINQPEKTSVFRILKAKAKEAERLHNVLIPEESLLKAIQLSERYLPNRQQPDKAIDLIEEASAKLRMILESKPEPLIEEEHVISDIKIEIEMINAKYTTGEMTTRDKNRIEELTKKLEKHTNEFNRLDAEYKKQRVLMDALIEKKEELDEAKDELKEVMHKGEFSRASELKTKVVPGLIKEVLQVEKEIVKHAETTDENLIQNVVTPIMVSRVIENQTGIPVTAQDEEDLEKYKNMDVVLSKEVHGQMKPIKQITDAIKRSKAGLSDPNKPLGSFLELGPTGVGKTYLAQKIAEFMFDTDKVLHRFDMSEFMEAHAVARLFGSPPGYVGHDEGGQLTEAIKRNPYSIILFDEIEKAHPRVFDALLQILDAGRMTDGKGEVVNFKNTIVIMTSNIGADLIRKGLQEKYPYEAIEIAILDEIKKHFRPEFLNRFDAKVVFQSLAPTAVIGIAESELKKLADRLSNDNEINLNWHPEMATMITNNAYDVADGARPIKRYINDIVINKLTEKVLNGAIKAGDSIFIQPTKTGNDIEMFVVQPEKISALQKKKIGIILKQELAEMTKPSDSGLKFELTLNEGKPKKKKKKKKAKDNTFELEPQAGDIE